jgi:hypothetical protein
MVLSVMSTALVSSYIKKCGAWFAFPTKTRSGTSKEEPNFRAGATADLAGSAANPPD